MFTPLKDLIHVHGHAYLTAITSKIREYHVYLAAKLFINVLVSFWQIVSGLPLNVAKCLGELPVFHLSLKSERQWGILNRGAAEALSTGLNTVNYHSYVHCTDTMVNTEMSARRVWFFVYSHYEWTTKNQPPTRNVIHQTIAEVLIQGS